MSKPEKLFPYPTYWVTVCAHKGGVGKTTVAAHLAASLLGQLKKHGSTQPRVLIIDLDPQANMTDAMASVPAHSHWLQQFCPILPDISQPSGFALPVRPTFANLLRKRDELTRDDIAACIEPVEGLPGLFLLPSGWDLERASYELVATLPQIKGLPPLAPAVRFIGTVFKQFDQAYDVVVIDCPPGLSPYVSAALDRAHRVVMPALPDAYSLRALYETRDSVHEAFKSGNSLVDVGAVVLMQYNNTQVSRDIHAALQRVWQDKLFAEVIPQRTIFRELAVSARPFLRNPLVFEMGKEYAELGAIFDRLADLLLQQSPRLLAARTHATNAQNPFHLRHVLQPSRTRPVPPRVAPPGDHEAPLAALALLAAARETSAVPLTTEIV